MAALPVTSQGVSGPAYTEMGAGLPRPRPLAQAVKGTKDGPTLQELRAAWRAYNGQFGPEHAPDDGPLAAQSGVPNLNVLSNRIRPIVNTGVDFLFGPNLTISCGEDTEDEDCQAIIDALWGDDDQRMTLLSKSGINGGVYGQVFLKVIPPKKGKPSAENPPRLVLLNPETLSVETDPDDADLVVRFVIEYVTTDASGNSERRRQTITRLDPDNDDATSGPDGLDDDTTWEIQNWVASGLAGGRYVEDGPAQAWPYQLPPIVDWQNYPNPNSHWGQRDVTDDLVALNRQLRLVESNINKIGFLQGHPYLYSTGTNTGGIKPTPGQILDLENENAELKAVNAAGDLAQLMAFADQLRADMDEASGIPGIALGRMKDVPRAPMSGIALRMINASALSRTEHKRRLYGQGIRQACQTALMLCGYSLADAEAVELKLSWQDPLPGDDLAEAQTWQVKTSALGYSQTTAIEETGGNPALEADRKQQEQQQQMTAFSQGQGMPPMDMQALGKSAAMNGPDGAADQEGGEPQPSTATKQQNTTPATPQQQRALNSPAARLQRARVAATAKGN